jgi:hypothetical protein
LGVFCGILKAIGCLLYFNAPVARAVMQDEIQTNPFALASGMMTFCQKQIIQLIDRLPEIVLFKSGSH